MSLMTARFTLDRPALSGLLPVKGAKHYIVAQSCDQVEGGGSFPSPAGRRLGRGVRSTERPVPSPSGEGGHRRAAVVDEGATGQTIDHTLRTIRTIVMLRILALETSDLTGGVAAAVDDKLLAEIDLEPRQRSAAIAGPGNSGNFDPNWLAAARRAVVGRDGRPRIVYGPAGRHCHGKGLCLCRGRRRAGRQHAGDDRRRRAAGDRKTVGGYRRAAGGCYRAGL